MANKTSTEELSAEFTYHFNGVLLKGMETTVHALGTFNILNSRCRTGTSLSFTQTFLYTCIYI